MTRFVQRMARFTITLAVLLSACSAPPPQTAAPSPTVTQAADPVPSATPPATQPAPTSPPSPTSPPPTATTPPTPEQAATGPGGFPAEISRGDPSKPQIALTFDAGSVSGLTAKTLDVLARQRVRSSFFVTGQFAEKYPQLVRRMATDGHEVWNHSYSHPDFTTLTDSQITEEMERTETILKGLTGKSSKPLMRMPFGARNQRVWRTVGNAGYRSVYWTLDSADWREGWTAPMVRDRVLSEAGNGFIVVHHSQPPATADSIEEIVVGLKQRGFELVTVTALIGQGGAASFLSTPLGQPPDPNDLMALVNKSTALPRDYVPFDLLDLAGLGVPTVNRGLQIRAVAAPHLKKMLDAARAAGLDIQVLSSYRSYADQQAIHAREVAAVGKAQAERYIAPPGHSQHQLGTTVDFTARSVNWDLSEDFANTPEGRWLAANAATYGFALSYPSGKESVTGYGYEPWHFRFLGIPVARDLAAKGITMEEYLSARN